MPSQRETDVSGVPAANMDRATRERWMRARVTHGAYRGGEESSTHAIWRGMIARCHREGSKHYRRYGGRGITVCKRWHKYENFVKDMGERPTGKSLERINNSLGYSPANCKWATTAEQARNTRANRWFQKGRTVDTLSGWAQRLGISKELAHWRMKNWNTFARGQQWQRLSR